MILNVIATTVEDFQKVHDMATAFFQAMEPTGSYDFYVERNLSSEKPGIMATPKESPVQGFVIRNPSYFDRIDIQNGEGRAWFKHGNDHLCLKYAKQENKK